MKVVGKGGFKGGWVGGEGLDRGRTGSKLPPKPSCCPNSVRRVMMKMVSVMTILMIIMVLMIADHFTDIAFVSPKTNICQMILLSNALWGYPLK